jgi:7-cyano-7-deazaguanine synthase
MPENQRPAVVLLSGGLDSATVLAIAQGQGFAVHAMSFRYGQRHVFELDCAKQIAAKAGVVQHVITEIDLRVFGSSALTSSEIAVPKDRNVEAMGESIPVTYVPARNTVFLSLALAWAEALGAFDIWIGVNSVDYSGYPDCRPEFIRAFEAVANLATRAGVEGTGRFRIHAPLLTLTKEQIIERGRALHVDYALTHSCYDPSPEGLSCGRCDACRIRRLAFDRLGLEDPIGYVPSG